MCDECLHYHTCTAYMYVVHVRQCKHSSHMYGVDVRRPYMYDSVNTA